MTTPAHAGEKLPDRRRAAAVLFAAVTGWSN